ncbi:MAG: Rrf2 family transcriptional regulator [Pseudomonadota bacterium]
MKLSKKGRYAVTAIMDLVLKAPYGPVTLNSISVSQEISMSYMEQLFAKLRKSGLVKGTRGPGGGYRLARPPEQITVAEILKAVDDSVESLNNDDRKVSDLSHMLWDELSKKVFKYLENITIQELLDQTALANTAAYASAASHQPRPGQSEYKRPAKETLAH